MWRFLAPTNCPVAPNASAAEGMSQLAAINTSAIPMLSSVTSIPANAQPHLTANQSPIISMNATIGTSTIGSAPSHSTFSQSANANTITTPAITTTLSSVAPPQPVLPVYPPWLMYDATHVFGNPHSLISSIEPFGALSTQNLDDFLNTIDLTAALGKWSEDLKITVALSRLRGKALQYMQMCTTPTSWAQMKQRLISRFGSQLNDQSAFSDLMMTQQKPGERVPEFAQRLCHLGFMALPDFQKDDIRLKFFVNGLRPSLRAAVMLRSPETYQEAYTIAVTAEVYDPASNSTRTSRACLINEGQRSTTRAPSPPPTSSQQFMCRYCKERGHTIDCCEKLLQKGQTAQRPFFHRSASTPPPSRSPLPRTINPPPNSRGYIPSRDSGRPQAGFRQTPRDQFQPRSPSRVRFNVPSNAPTRSENRSSWSPRPENRPPWTPRQENYPLRNSRSDNRPSWTPRNPDRAAWQSDNSSRRELLPSRPPNRVRSYPRADSPNGRRDSLSR